MLSPGCPENLNDPKFGLMTPKTLHFTKFEQNHFLKLWSLCPRNCFCIQIPKFPCSHRWIVFVNVISKLFSFIKTRARNRDILAQKMLKSIILSNKSRFIKYLIKSGVEADKRNAWSMYEQLTVCKSHCITIFNKKHCLAHKYL